MSDSIETFLITFAISSSTSLAVLWLNVTYLQKIAPYRARYRLTRDNQLHADVNLRTPEEVKNTLMELQTRMKASKTK